MDLTFVTDYLWANKTVPVLIYNNDGEKLFSINLGNEFGDDATQPQFDSLRDQMALRFDPIKFEDEGHVIYYDESTRLKNSRRPCLSLFHLSFRNGIKQRLYQYF